MAGDGACARAAIWYRMRRKRMFTLEWEEWHLYIESSHCQASDASGMGAALKTAVDI